MGKYTIISTIGVSLLGGLKRNQIDVSLPTKQIVEQILSLENHHQISAETSSIHSLIHDQILEESHNLYLLASDTEEGRKINEVLKQYYKTTFKQVFTLTIEKLKWDGT